MKIYLLTHERELKKETNTGAIAIKHGTGAIERIMWQRLNPSTKLVKLIENSEALLLYPSEDAQATEIAGYDNFIIIDATWQESRKIYNKSQYLKKMPHATIKLPAESAYKLRRNQVDGGLCTIECVIEVLKVKDKNDLAEKLAIEFWRFNKKEF